MSSDLSSDLLLESESEGEGVGVGVGVGLSSPQLSEGRRRMLDLVNRLHNTGVQVDMDLPMIAVIGSQSAGKSSLIESISGITLPRAAGTCTRCPTECRLSYSPESWCCTVSLLLITDVNGQPLGSVRTEKFGDKITNKSDVEERIRRAQRAILNPHIPAATFLTGEDEDPHEVQLSFSKNYVSLQISGKDVADLSFVDLPGLIASVGKGGHESDIELVRNLVTSYISRPSCLILLTVACETDFENQGAHHLAKVHDPEGKRTIGVLTKPDRIPTGEEDRWLRFVRNEYEALLNNWYCVKQPNSKALTQGISWAEARAQENQFFSTAKPWCELESTYQKYLRTGNLTERLSIILSELITKRLPEIQNELQKLLQKTQDSLLQLPKAPSNDALGEVLHLVGSFCRDLSQELEGVPDEDGLLQSIRPAQRAFRKVIRETAPDFRPYERKFASSRTLVSPDFLHDEPEEDNAFSFPEPVLVPPKFQNNAIYIDEIFIRAEKARTRQLPGHYPFVIHEVFVSQFTKKWHEPVQELYQTIHTVLTAHIKKIILRHFSAYGQGGLQQRVLLILNDHIKDCLDRTIMKVGWLLGLEDRPFTLNEHYYSDYKVKFLSFYKANRDDDVHRTLLHPPATKYVKGRDVTNDAAENLKDALSALANAGIPGVVARDLAKLLPPDPFDKALQIMADVSAYFQVAYKRFTDNIPLTIDYELIRGLDRNVEQILYKGLGITGPDSQRICREYIQEHPSMSSRREELQKRWERLSSASQELVHLGI